MLVPQFWAEGRVQVRQKRKQVTVRRWGWSDLSQQEAQANADARAAEALVRLQRGEKLQRREPKVAYNGAEGVPIREEILSRQGQSVVTRNLYGAQCLNTPNVLFADIDFAEDSSGALGCLIAGSGILGAVVLGRTLHSRGWALAALALSLVVWWLVEVWRSRHVGARALRQEQAARQRVEQFAKTHPQWRLRLYRTPRGFRVLVMHRTFEPGEPAVAECFKALGTDPVYVRMCQKQRCFRARVSPKPWRIGIEAHIKPRPGVWPIQAERLPARQAWVKNYEQVANGYASCHFELALGSGPVDPEAAAVQALHDQLCQAGTNLPLG